jgi:tRNA 2-selenouridine synthase SelU
LQNISARADINRTISQSSKFNRQMALPVLKKTLITEFLKMAETIPITDVRSPLEFAAGHIPGAFNIPLFNDKEREAVGLKYKKEGRNKAILTGLELTGTLMHEKLREALKIASEGRIGNGMAFFTGRAGCFDA